MMYRMSREDDLLQELNAARADETRRRQEEELRRIRAEEKRKMQEEELRRIRAEERRRMQEEELRRIRAEERRKMQAQGMEDPAEARRRYEEQQLERYREEERLRQEQQLRQYQMEERIRQEQEKARRDVEQRMMQEGLNDRQAAQPQGQIQMPGRGPAQTNRVQIPGQEPLRNQPEPLKRAPQRGQFMNQTDYGYPEAPQYDYDEEDEAPRGPRPPRRKKKKNPVARFFRTFFLILAILLVLGVLAVVSITSRFEHVETEVSKDPNSMKGDKVTILLIGQDARPGEDEQRADSMILCTIDRSNRSVILVSLMRDMYVDIPGYGGNRLNAAYAFGGIDLLDQTIEENFGVRVDGNAVVNFDGFVKAMTAVGKLDINLTADEAAYMLEDPSAGTQNYDPVDWDLHEGMNSLDPEQVLCYARMRHVGNSDWDRTKRQRIVITTALAKVKKGHLIGGYRMALGIAPNIKTDLKTMGMLRLAWGFIKGKEVKSYHLPVDGAYYDDNIDGMAVLVPDLDQNRMYLEQFMNGEGEEDK